jgi:hypothetical protein
VGIILKSGKQINLGHISFNIKALFYLYDQVRKFQRWTRTFDGFQFSTAPGKCEKYFIILFYEKVSKR